MVSIAYIPTDKPGGFTLVLVKKYLASGDYRGDLKPFNVWKGRKKVDISFRDSFSGNEDRLKNNAVPDETYICSLPKKIFPAFYNAPFVSQGIKYAIRMQLVNSQNITYFVRRAVTLSLTSRKKRYIFSENWDEKNSRQS